MNLNYLLHYEVARMKKNMLLTNRTHLVHGNISFMNKERSRVERHAVELKIICA